MRRPSPSLVVSIVAVVLAGAGTSIAAVNFAKNAGAVDGKSAVGHFSSNAKAAGKLVATGAQGKLPARFLDLSGVVAGSKQSYAHGIEVVDNSSSTPVGLGGAPGVGLLTATCRDGAPAAGVEDPEVTITFANGSPHPVNWARQVGRGAADVSVVPPSAQTAFTVAGSNVFRVHVAVAGVNYVFEGAVRQDRRDTAAAGCAVFGYGLVL